MGEIKMNKEIAKAIKRKEKKTSAFNFWWRKNDYKVYRIIFFPLWIASIVLKKISRKLNKKNFWNEKRANEILNYYIPRRSRWYAEEQEFYFFDNGYGWSTGLAKKYLKRKDRRFWEVNNGFSGGKIREFLIDEFELEGFTKEVGNCSDGWTEITFKMIEN